MPGLVIPLLCIVALVPALLVGISSFFIFRKKPNREVISIVFVGITYILFFIGLPIILPLLSEAPYSNPPPLIVERDLIGVWKTDYDGFEHDKLIIYSDNTFEQFYQNTQTNQTFRSERSPFWLEKFPNGEVRIHFEDGRFYLNGTIEGLKSVHMLYDPFLDEILDTENELVLHVRMRNTGELILHHLWASSDRGFLIFGGETEIFHRVQE